jgi:membrane-associated phospholipid phosphatase
MNAFLADVERLDLSVYRAIAATPTPTLDEPLRRISSFANHSKPWLLIACVMFFSGKRWRRRAGIGLTAIAVNSAVVNLPFKIAGRRPRPDRDAAHVPESRRVPMPDSASFPSGHTASGFAFAAAVASVDPALATLLRTCAGVVGYSRVHTGVHYPGDVIVGALVGSTIGETVAFAAQRRDANSHVRPT